MPRGRLLTIGAVLISSLFALPGSASGQEPALDFAGGSSFEVTWSELSQGRKLTVCNGTATELAPSVLLSEFRFTKKGRRGEAPVRTPDAVTADLQPPLIPRGACGDLELKAKADSGVSGSFTGFILLVGPGIGVTRAELKISDAPSEAAQISGVSEQATLAAVNEAPWSDGDLQDGGELLLKPPPAGQGPLQLGKECASVDEDTKPPPGCPFIGNLFNGNEIASVYVAGKPEVEKGVVELPVRIWPHEHLVGNYEGSLDPAASGDKDQMIKVKLTGSDSWVAALITVMLGAILTLVCQWIVQKRRPRARLERRKDAIRSKYLPDGNPAIVPGRPDLVVDKANVEDYLDGDEGVQKAIDAYCSTVLFISSDSDAYKKIDASLALAEDDAGAIRDERKLAAVLGSLQTELDKARKLVSDKDLGDSSTEPLLFEVATAPLAAGELGVGEATERSKRAKEISEWLGAWEKMAGSILLYRLWAAAIKLHDESGRQPTLSPEEKQDLTETGIALTSLREEFFRATGAADLERLRVSGRIEAAFGALSYLGGRSGVSMPTGKEDLEGGDAEGAVAAMSALPGRRMLRQPAVQLQSQPPTAASAATVASHGGRILKVASTWLVDLLILVVGMLPAVVGALAAVYFGKNFGTLDGYLQLLAAGAVGQALVKVLQDNFEIFYHDIRATTPVEPAVVKLPVVQA